MTRDDRALAVDAAAVLVGSLAIVGFAHHLRLMTVLVPCLFVLRTAARARWVGGALGAELAVLGLCTALGAFNDFNTVVRKGIYAYHVPVERPEISTIPLWMLLFWGLVLRLMLTLGRWRAGPRRDAVAGRPLPVLKVGLQLALVFATKQAIAAWYLDPWWSWLPFLAALVVHALLFGLDAHDRWLMGVAVVVGPIVEILFIQVGGLHSYPLGWIGGVPLWIALWWMLAVVIWKDVGGRVVERLGG